jgi:excisionase family DNA binding protein
MAVSANGLNGMMRAKQAAPYVGVCYTTFLKMLKTAYRPKIPRYKIRNKYYFRRDELDTWIESHRQK